MNSFKLRSASYFIKIVYCLYFIDDIWMSVELMVIDIINLDVREDNEKIRALITFYNPYDISVLKMNKFLSFLLLMLICPCCYTFFLLALL